MRTYLVFLCMAFGLLATAGSSNAQTATQDVNISASVDPYCTIANIINPADLNATITVTDGVVDTTPIPFPVASVACNSAADVIATSLSGGVTPGGAAPGGTTNIINYTGTAAFSTATSTINTATLATATGNEAGNTATTGGAATGTLTITITPAQPALPLAPSALYADTLQVTLTAQ